MTQVSDVAPGPLVINVFVSKKDSKGGNSLSLFFETYNLQRS
jgi:hypothetical protein